jgi:hypothetical protein
MARSNPKVNLKLGIQFSRGQAGQAQIVTGLATLETSMVLWGIKIPQAWINSF